MSNKKLRIAHYPQIPCEPYIVHVSSLWEAQLIYNTLANYDLFLLQHGIRGDYNNVIEIEEFDADEGDWVTWYDDQTGIGDINEYFEYQNNDNNEEV